MWITDILILQSTENTLEKLNPPWIAPSRCVGIQEFCWEMFGSWCCSEVFCKTLQMFCWVLIWHWWSICWSKRTLDGFTLVLFRVWCSHVHLLLQVSSRSAPGPVASGLSYTVNSIFIVSPSSGCYGRSKNLNLWHIMYKSQIWSSGFEPQIWINVSLLSLWCTTAAVATVGGDHGFRKCPEINMMWLVSALEGRRKKTKHYCNSTPQLPQL